MSFEIHDPNKMKISDFLTDYNPLWYMLETLHAKLSVGGKQGLKELTLEEVWKRIYEFGVVSAGLEKADLHSRVDVLTEQNIKWCTLANTYEAEVATCKVKIQELSRELEILQERLKEEGHLKPLSSTDS